MPSAVPKSSPFNPALAQRASSRAPAPRRSTLGAAVLLAVVGWALSPAEAAVFGDDERGPVTPAWTAAAANVGILHDRELKPICTAFCVGRRTIATAAHCLAGKSGAPMSRARDFTFTLDPTDGVRSHSRLVPAPQPAQETGDGGAALVTGSATLRMKPPIESAGDWALAHLETPICTGGGLRLSTRTPAEVAASVAARRTVNLAFHKDRADAGILLAGNCGVGAPHTHADPARIAREFAHPERLLLHTCDTAAGSSGSPLVVDGAYGPEVIGVNVGSYVQSTILLDKGEVIERTMSQPIANTAASAAPIARALEALDADEAVTDAPSLAELRVLLTVGAPRPSGTDDALRQAIVAHQAQHGLPTTGIATRGLLQGLRAAAAQSAVDAKRRRVIETGSTR